MAEIDRLLGGLYFYGVSDWGNGAILDEGSSALSGGVMDMAGCDRLSCSGGLAKLG
jgi:hypothetical protein